jgi:NAD(P)-dependent dehydrogenase (short-subunit alcohol dehydrogenase family)
MGRLEHKVVTVTGAARGMGAAMAQLFAAEGAAVILVDLPSSQGEKTADSIRAAGRQAQFIGCDVKEEAQVQALIETARETYGRLDGLVNVAGINRKYRIDEMPVEEWDIMMAVNVRGFFLMIKHAVPLMRQTGGAIVNMSSISSFIATDGYCAYHTTKGAVLSMTKALSLELAQQGIRINAICPGWVDTQFSDDGIDRTSDPAATRQSAEAGHILNRFARPDEIAQAALWLLSDESSFVVGEGLIIDGGFLLKK